MTVPSYSIASIPGDGIGPEVIAAAIEVVMKLASTLRTFSIEFTELPWGSDYWKETGSYVLEDYLETYRKFDASLFGSMFQIISLFGVFFLLLEALYSSSPMSVRCEASPVPKALSRIHPPKESTVRSCVRTQKASVRGMADAPTLTSRGK
ncbi:hypothetical protein SI65_05090 [Aspergillus cristatus]|uniref:Isopropylmalate dehydrogenase-like domain-containing protein n=1 Tax=Aspergillus cristatus TaxID=573508 RepID=A0A1E3BGK9_ASPCR|nr:hypothetical protein SI65_05090 [Aspergillus cristatus]